MAGQKFHLDESQATALRQILSSGRVTKEEGRRLVEAVGINGKPSWIDGGKVDTGGSAYPLKEALTSDNEGMTFLDAAAIAALQVVGPYMAQFAQNKAAEIAYDMAEAMVAEKRKRENV